MAHPVNTEWYAALKDKYNYIENHWQRKSGYPLSQSATLQKLNDNSKFWNIARQFVNKILSV